MVIYPSEKIWLWRQRTPARAYRRWEKGKGVRSQPYRGGVCYSWGEISPYKHPARFVKKIAKKDSFFSLNFNIDTNLDKREKARDRNIWQRRQISLEEKHENSIVAVRKFEMLRATKVKMSGSEITKWPLWSLRSLRSAIVAIIWKPGSSLYIIYRFSQG